MKRRMSWTGLLAVMALLMAPGMHAQPSSPPNEAGATRVFIACPVYRDTDAGRKSGCWLADDPTSGKRYDISLGLIKPQLGHAVLVEGVVADPTVESSALCGGDVLVPLQVSVLPERCPRYLAPAEQYPGRPYKFTGEQLRPAFEPRTLPEPPYDVRAFTIFFELGREFLVYQYSEVILEKISLYVSASHARRVRIEGFAATEPRDVDGRVLSEPARLAEARANMVAEALRRLGVPADNITVSWQALPAPHAELAEGRLQEASKRRVTITVEP
ncbi:MAG: OmpA family protein [Polyangiales bacterium]